MRCMASKIVASSAFTSPPTPLPLLVIRDLARMFSCKKTCQCCKVRALVKFMFVCLLVLQSACISQVSARV